MTLVLGAQFGDEGKGKLVDQLCQEGLDVCCRFNGGSNAGHTIVVDDKKYATHLLPSGILTDKCINILGNGMVIHLPTLFRELDSMSANGVQWQGRVLVSDRAHVVFDFHQITDGLAEAELGASQLGTTKRGIGPCYSDKAARCGLRVAELVGDKFEEQFRTLVALTRRRWGADKLVRVASDGKHVPYDEQAELSALLELRTRMRAARMVVDTSAYLQQAFAAKKTVLLEGANATLLDLDHGTYPFVTSSSPSFAGAALGLGISPRLITKVIGVVKAYLTRVGSGPFPTELHDAVGERLRSIGHEFGTTTGRPRRCGWLDLNLVVYAHRLNGFDALNLTKLDVLTGLPELKIAVGYTLDGVALPLGSFMADLSQLERVGVVYETLPGWTENLASCKKLADLPANARAYIARIEAVTGVRVSHIGVGAGRTETIVCE